MKVLFVSPVLEHPPAGGPALRIENSIKALARVSELHIVSRVSRGPMGGISAENFYRGLCRTFSYAPSAQVSANKYVRKVQKGLHAIFSFMPDIEFLLAKIEEHEIDVLWCGYGNISFGLIDRIKRLRPALKIVCDTDSVWSRFVLRELPFQTNPVRRFMIEKEGRRVEARERRSVDLCDVTTAVSEVDAEYYRGIARRPERVMMFSNVIDLKTYEQAPPAVPGFRKPCIYLAGSFFRRDCPMDRAARWIVEEVLPKVKKEIPDIHLYIVGKGSDRLCAGYRGPSITVTGMLPSVLPYLCHVDVALVPLQFESGTRFKIMEAGACRIPIVSTTLGAEGIPVVHGQDILLADTSEDFASAIIKLIREKDLARRLSNNCLELIQKKYSVEHLSREAEMILQRLQGV